MWFVSLLLITETIFYFINVFKNKVDSKYLYFILISIFTSMCGLFCIKNNIRGNIDLSLLMVPVMVLGNLYRMNEKKINKFITSYLWIFTGLLILFINILSNQQIELSLREIYGSLPGMYFMITLGIIFCLSFSKMIVSHEKIKVFLYYCSLSSYYIMALHFFIFKMIDFVWYWIFNEVLSLEKNTIYFFPYSYPYLRLIYILLGVLIPIVIYLIIDKLKCIYNLKG